MQRYEAHTGIIENNAERIALESAVDILVNRNDLNPDPWYGPKAAVMAANQARIFLKEQGIEPTVSAIIWRAGAFPRHEEQGPFWFYSAA